MMSVYELHKNFVLVLLCIVFITKVYPVMLRERYDQIRSLEKLLSENKPIVLVLNGKTQERSSDFDDLFNNNNNEDGLENGDDYDEKVTDKSYPGYLLDHHLRTDSVEGHRSIEDTKEILRTALRARCQQVEKCMKKCPPKRPFCPKNCQEVYDNSNLCSPPPKPKKCKRPKCGKTMPPSWRF